MAFEKDSFATHRGNRVQITAANHPHYDVQQVDDAGAVKLDANGQPQWTGGVHVDELSAEKTPEPEKSEAPEKLEPKA
jgi:hypothetical protein